MFLMLSYKMNYTTTSNEWKIFNQESNATYRSILPLVGRLNILQKSLNRLETSTILTSHLNLRLTGYGYYKYWTGYKNACKRKCFFGNWFMRLKGLWTNLGKVKKYQRLILTTSGSYCAFNPIRAIIISNRVMKVGIGRKRFTVLIINCSIHARECNENEYCNKDAWRLIQEYDFKVVNENKRVIQEDELKVHSQANLTLNNGYLFITCDSRSTVYHAYAIQVP